MPSTEFVVDFKTLGHLVSDWIQQHCIVPDGFAKGRPYVMADWQLWCTVNHYRVREDAVWDPELPRVSTNFVYRRSQVVAPQKALALDTPIATPSGWTTMGDVQPGEFVFDEQGAPTRVLSKSRVWESDTYRVTFSDGASLVACGDHQWWVEKRTPSATYVEARVRTEDMARDLVDAHGARRYRVPVARPLDLPEVDLPVDPYVLGAWLGDGNADDGRLTGLDREVFDRIALAGYEVRQMTALKRVNVIGLKAELRAAGVLRNKHIPEVYLRASEKQRWALLQGLMDTDGYADVRQGKCEFTTTLPALRDGVSELLHSLGIKHVSYAGDAALYGRVTGPKWRTMFAARADMPVFHLDRKQARLRPANGGHAQFGHRRVVAVERVDTVPTQCLTVEAASHVFLAGREMIPTCNTGKGPWSAAIIACEGLGPTVFRGWAAGGETYECADHGCDCGWVYVYGPGEPMGIPRPTPLIQLTATSKEQTANVYRPLKAMFRGGGLEVAETRTGEEFIRLPDDGRIDTVTSSAQSKLGNPVTFVLHDESGIYTKSNGMMTVADTQLRGLAGMDARALETTNPWDPSQRSTAQLTFESSVEDIFRFYREPPAAWSYRNRDERRKIHRFVYEGSWWVNLDAIEGLALEMMDRGETAQAERFFGNRRVRGAGTWLPDGLWASRERVTAVPDGAEVCAGFDGSDTDDWTGIRLETREGFQFTPTYGPDARPTVWNPAEFGGRIPRIEVHAAWSELNTRYRIRRAYLDPPLWQTELEDWALLYGEDVFVPWATYRTTQMHAALQRTVVDLSSGRLWHDGCRFTRTHVDNARRAPRPGERYILMKPSQPEKIDMAMCSTLAHEAAADQRAAGWDAPRKGLTRVTGRVSTY
jgi:hypothetical protein